MNQFQDYRGYNEEKRQSNVEAGGPLEMDGSNQERREWCKVQGGRVEVVDSNWVLTEILYILCYIYT